MRIQQIQATQGKPIYVIDIEDEPKIEIGTGKILLGTVVSYNSSPKSSLVECMPYSFSGKKAGQWFDPTLEQRFNSCYKPHILAPIRYYAKLVKRSTYESPTTYPGADDPAYGCSDRWLWSTYCDNSSLDASVWNQYYNGLESLANYDAQKKRYNSFPIVQVDISIIDYTYNYHMGHRANIFYYSIAPDVTGGLLP